MPFFKKAVVVEEPPTLYETAVSCLNSAASAIESALPSPDDVQHYVDKIAENKIFALTALFVIVSIVLCVPLTSALEDMKKEKRQEDEQEVTKSKELVQIMNIEEEEIVALTASPSNSSANDDDDSSSDESLDIEDDGEISDDASVEETYNDFLLKVTESKDQEPEVYEDDSQAAVTQVTTTTAADDVSMLTETPLSSPPGTPQRRGSGSSKSTSMRTSLKKRLSLKMSNRNLSFKNLKKMAK
jgi:hypothetical protein